MIVICICPLGQVVVNVCIMKPMRLFGNSDATSIYFGDEGVVSNDGVGLW